MLEKNYCVTANSEDEVYRLMRLAANYHLYGMYKIGVYGKEHQHELFIVGKPWNYRKFMKQVRSSTNETVISVEQLEGA